MELITIIKCVGCGDLFKIYGHEVYRGDIRYCRDCNRKAK